MAFNPNILSGKVRRWLSENVDSEAIKIVLKGSPFEGVSAQELAEQVQSCQKTKQKIPTFYSAGFELYFPPKISVEQASSEVTAMYKAKITSGNILLDITGGMGIDDFYFSERMEKVIHCEINHDLSQRTAHNFAFFQKNNIECVAENGVEILQNLPEKIDWLFIDPARRSEKKGKVFLLEDCTPNILELENIWLKKCRKVMIKTSPLIDISYGLKALKNVSEIHIVAVKNEVKELLWIIDNEKFSSETCCKTVNLQSEKVQSFEFVWGEESKVENKYSTPQNYLFEPNASLMKSGRSELLITEQIKKLHRFSHLFTSLELPEISFPGKTFRIIEVFLFKKENVKRFSGKKINVVTRNFQQSPEQIKKKFKIKDGGSQFLFFTTNLREEKIVILCEKST